MLKVILKDQELSAENNDWKCLCARDPFLANISLGLVSLKGLESTIINISYSNINEKTGHSPFENCSIYLDVIYQLFNGKNEAKTEGEIFLRPEISG